MANAAERQVEGARTQSLFREVNERIEAVGGAHEVNGEVLCECTDEHCVETIPLTLADYEATRRIPTHFVVMPGHDVPDIERVVEEKERYVVVEKFGEAGVAAVRLDPRRRSSGKSNIRDASTG